MIEFLDFLKGFDIQNILCIIAVVWFFTKGIKEKLESVQKDIKSMDTRLTKLETEMEHQKGMMQTIVGFLLGHKAG